MRLLIKRMRILCSLHPKYLLFLSLSIAVSTFSLPVLARGGHSSSSGRAVHVRSYFRKDGTYVHSYDRSAPNSGSSVQSTPYANTEGFLTTDNPSPESLLESTDRSSEVQSNTVKMPGFENNVTVENQKSEDRSVKNQEPEFQFPQTSCGDSGSAASKTWFPVFIDNGDLDKIRQQYCQDAVKTTRTDTNTPSIQTASFTDREKASRFAQAVGGSVGQPATPEDLRASINKTGSEARTSQSQLSQKPQLNQNSESPTAQPLLNQNSKSSNSETSTSQPQNNQGTAGSKANNSATGLVLALACGCVWFGYNRIHNR